MQRPLGIGPLGRPRIARMGNMKVDLKGLKVWTGFKWFTIGLNGGEVGTCEDGTEPVSL